MGLLVKRVGDNRIEELARALSDKVGALCIIEVAHHHRPLLILSIIR